MTAPDARQSDDLREALAEALNAKVGMCDEFDPNDLDSGCPDCADLLRYVDAILPVVTAWAESQARARAAEEQELATLRAYVQDTMGAFGAWCVDRLIAEGPAALAADDRTDQA